MEIVRGLIGVVSLIGIAYLFSQNRKNIDWRLVGIGISLQLLFAIFLKFELIQTIFNKLGMAFVQVLSFSEKGSSFLFGYLIPLGKADGSKLIFAIHVLPTIIFFSAITSGLYHLGVLQKIVYGIAWVMTKTMRMTGAEGLSAAGNIFLGQTEAPLLIKPFIPKMNNSQLMCVMIGGMATIAGGVMAAYVQFLGKGNTELMQFYATSLLSASIMNAPAAIVFSKVLVPEHDRTQISRKMEFSNEKNGANLIDAIANGTADGLKLAANVGAMLIAFIALISLINFVFEDLIGATTNLNSAIQASTDGKFQGFSLQFILGMVFRPIAWLVGVDWQDTLLVASMLGEKTVINEFVAYAHLAELPNEAISFQSRVITTYALCGFSNFSSIAIQIGGIGSIAPDQKANVSRLGLLAVLGGTLACLSSATIAGMFSSF